jgi:hypothetical protein
MAEDEAKHRAERAERADQHVAAQRRRSEAESTKARVLVDRFVAEATERGILTQERRLGRGLDGARYRTGVVGGYLRSGSFDRVPGRVELDGVAVTVSVTRAGEEP